MIFASLEFIFLFLPLVFVLWYMGEKYSFNLAKTAIILSSFVFYFLGSPQFFLSVFNKCFIKLWV